MSIVQSTTSQKCFLCDSQTELRNSHLIPRFVADWLKSTSATGYLRQVTNPNKRLQDFEKRRLLCGLCENRFSVWENNFKQRIFAPYQERVAQGIHQHSFQYNEWLRRFAISLSWRIARTEIEDFQDKQPDLALMVDNAVSTWQSYLLHDNVSHGAFEQHILFLDEIRAVRNVELPEHIHAYLLRSVDATIFASSKYVGVYVKLPGIVFVSSICPFKLPGWRSTVIHEQGLITIPQRIKPSPVDLVEFILDRANIAAQAMKGLSERQEEKIVQDMKSELRP